MPNKARFACFFFFSSRRRHTRSLRDWSSDVCSSDLPNALFTGSHFEWRVPMDDENTLSVTWAFERVPKEQEPYVQGAIPSWHGPIKDPETGRWITSRSEERRVGKECRSRWGPDDERK